MAISRELLLTSSVEINHNFEYSLFTERQEIFLFKKNRISKILVLSFTIASLLTTSFGGAVATSALAAEVTTEQKKKPMTVKTLLPVL